MSCCKPKRLKLLLEACVNDKLFDIDLNVIVFKCIIEIVKNARKKKFSHCFSAKTRKKMQKYASFINKIVNSKTPIKKRLKKFVNCQEKVQKVFYKNILRDFIHNCLDHD